MKVELHSQLNDNTTYVKTKIQTESQTLWM